MKGKENMYSQYISPFGYQTGTHGIDSYGVNHKDFDIRDEIEYQFARAKRENELMEQYKSLGITDKFPQYGTNFWGNSDNNYGFGISNIASNIANMKHTATPIPLSSTSQIQNIQQPITQQDPLQQVVGAVKDMIRNYVDMKQDNTIGADDYFHCKANYEAAQRGDYGAVTAQILGDEKEVVDYLKNRFYKGMPYSEALADYWHDKDVNNQGRAIVNNSLYSKDKADPFAEHLPGQPGSGRWQRATPDRSTDIRGDVPP